MSTYMCAVNILIHPHMYLPAIAIYHKVFSRKVKSISHLTCCGKIISATQLNFLLCIICTYICMHTYIHTVAIYIHIRIYIIICYMVLVKMPQLIHQTTLQMCLTADRATFASWNNCFCSWRSTAWW